jgi:trehalose synthase
LNVASLTTEHFGTPTSARARRALDSARKRALDRLAGRTVWSAVALPGGRPGARRVAAGLRWAGGSGVSARSLDVTAGDPLLDLARRLEGRLSGTSGTRSDAGAADREVYADGMGAGEGLVARRVRPGDVVVLHDPLTAALSKAIRERGAHAVWQVRIGSAPREATVDEAWSFLRAYTETMDAYVVTRGSPMPGGVVVGQVAALIPSSGVLSAKLIEGGQESDDLAWSSILADVVAGDRDETVGGTHHPRPAVAPR